VTHDVNAIWQDFSEGLMRFILKRVRDPHDAEDIRQEVFAKIHRNIDSLRDTRKLPAWVYQIARNTIIEHYRGRRAAMEPPEMLREMPDEPPAELQAADHVVSWLRPMVERLPDKYRRPLLLTEFDGLPQKEMAQALGLSLSGAKSRVQRAREQLKEMVLACCHLEFDRRGKVVDFRPREPTCPFCQGHQDPS